MTRYKVRDYFLKNNIHYTDLGTREIAQLRLELEKELKNHNIGIDMELNKNQSFIFDDKGSLIQGEFRVEGRYFNDREAITFNRDGFIGFAGWSDDNNIKPFVNAFKNWIDKLKNSSK